jgi:hypothetical protein
MTTGNQTTEWAIEATQRMFAAFDRTPSGQTISEWQAVMLKFRADDAMESLINGGKRLPTIAEFRTEAMRFYGQRVRESNQDEIAPVLREVARQADQENRAFWNSKFGDSADIARRTIGETCQVAKSQRRAAEKFAELLTQELTHDERFNALMALAGTIEVADERELRRRIDVLNQNVLSSNEKIIVKKTIDAAINGW